MLRKFAILAFGMMTLAGLVLAADDDESPTKKLMEQINKKNQPIQKATRKETEYKKGSATIPKNVEEIIEIAKKAREIKEPAEIAKKPFADYQKSMDAMIKSAEDLSKLVAKAGTTHAQAKEAYTTYYKTCTACHEVFKKDE